jgi:Family of unknown function (DUF6338)
VTSLEEAAATLRLVVPGFLALRLFYWRALPTRRTDLELVLFGLVASVPIYWLAARIVPPATGAGANPTGDLGTLSAALIIAAAASEVAARLWWWAVGRWPNLRPRLVSTAWDGVLGRPGGGWLQVTTSDGTIYHGWLNIVADTAQTDEPDLYLMDPEYVVPPGTLVPIPRVEGVLIPRSSIVSVLRLLPAASTDAGAPAPIPDA